MGDNSQPSLGFIEVAKKHPRSATKGGKSAAKVDHSTLLLQSSIFLSFLRSSIGGLRGSV